MVIRRKIDLKNKKAAFEMSVSTVIIIVLAVSMLIVGLAFIGNLRKFSLDTIDNLQRKTMDEVNRLFTDENQKIVIYLGEDKIAPISAGTDNKGILIAAKTEAGSKVNNRTELQFKLELDETPKTNCVGILGKAQATRLFKTPLNQWNNMNRFSGDTAFDTIYLTVPEGTTLCTQKVFVQIIDRSVDTQGVILGGDYFILEVKRKSIF